MSSQSSVSDPLAKWTGTWKRATTNFAFGTFTRGKDTASIVMVEPVVAISSESNSSTSTTSSTTNAVRWSFGSNIDTIRVGFTLQTNSPNTTSGNDGSGSSSSALSNNNNNNKFSWRKLGVTFGANSTDSSGMIREDGGVLTLTLVSNALATIVYKMLDDDTVAVSITEVPERGVATVQQGFMFRVA